ncbi:hypothetical protein HDU87_003291 [Geranomyces variabilis]|uniref:CCHC-type domain-containing protein n=1 Tax=Geranomyces variabilis TaxID=109894 RepID=A0AAD5TK37_9FUNG|nr:hypothetical protein HDU87_003291 [Geranomyces variabilis]
MTVAVFCVNPISARNARSQTASLTACVAVYNNEYMECISTLSALNVTIPVDDLKRWYTNGLRSSADRLGRRIEQEVTHMVVYLEMWKPEIAGAKFISQMLKCAQVACSNLCMGTAAISKEVEGKEGNVVAYKHAAAEVNAASAGRPAKQPRRAHPAPTTGVDFTGKCYNCHEHGHRARNCPHLPPDGQFTRAHVAALMMDERANGSDGESDDSAPDFTKGM